MVNKKGEGVKGVLSGLTSRDRERGEAPPSPAPSDQLVPAPPETLGEQQLIAPTVPTLAEPPAPAASERASKKPTGIKGRPRTKKDPETEPAGERVKVTLSIETVLRDQFYRLAHSEMMQPGEFVERALRYYISHHPKRG